MDQIAQIQEELHKLKKVIDGIYEKMYVER
jgi:hypothetical protein